MPSRSLVLILGTSIPLVVLLTSRMAELEGGKELSLIATPWPKPAEHSSTLTTSNKNFLVFMEICF
jgi:hypothetical protein